MSSLPQTEPQDPTKTSLTHSPGPEQPIEGLRVLFMPWYTRENPYQQKLANHLEQLGHQVESINCSTSSLLKTVKARKVDILHLHWLQYFFLEEASSVRAFLKLIVFSLQLLLLRLQNVKIIWTVHNLKNHKNQYVLIDRLGSILVSRIAHRLIAHSETAKQEIIRTFRLASKQVHVVPHGNYVGSYENQIDRLDARKQLEIPETSLVFLFFGLIHPYKGVLELVQAFTKLTATDVMLVIAGQPKDDVLVQQLQQAAAATQKIKLKLGFVPDEDVQVYMNACDVVALPYREFLTSGAVILAMSFGKACIAPSKGYTGEVLDSKGAFLYDPDSERGLFQALNSAVQKRESLSQMGNHNYQLASQWNWNAIAQKTVEVYQHPSS